MASGRITLEVCVASAAGASAAEAAGADRIELNGALELGGLTPTRGLVAETLAGVNVPVIAMLRPRGGGFGYAADELRVMRRDQDDLLATGVAGVAFGVLTAAGDVDAPACRELVRACAGREAVFHRAFDEVREPMRALEELIDLGFARVLTSGQAPTAVEGAALIRRLIERAAGRIEVLPGAGVTPANAAGLVRDTGATQVHGSFRGPDGIVDPAQVRAARGELDRLVS